MFDRIIQWSLSHRLLVIFGYVVLLAAGLVVLQTLPADVFPEFAPPQVVIQTQAPGMSPQDVESLVTLPLETAINGTPNVESVRSSSSVGLSTVTVVFKWGTNIYQDRQLVSERLQSARERFPQDVQASVMLPVTSAVGWLIKYSLTSSTVSPMDLRTLSDWSIRPRILSIPGIASVVSIGGGVKQYQVELSPDKLRAFGLTLEDALHALESANRNVPGGFLVRSGQEYITTGLGRIRPNSLADVANIVVAERGNTPILVSNIADVKFGEEPKRGDGAFMGDPAVIGTVSKLYGADTLSTTYKVEEALKEIKAALPPGVSMDIVFRQATFIEHSITNLNHALVEGGIIVVLILFLFLLNLRTSFISFLAIPTSLLFAVIVMKIMGIGINVMTLGGLAIAIGEVVDDAIIGVENVFRRLRENRALETPEPALRVVSRASSEVRNSVVYATLIVLVVFSPIFFLSGIEGRIFAPLGVAYIAALISSLIVALTLTPVLCHLLLAGRFSTAEHETKLIAWLKRKYLRILEPCLRHPARVISLSLVLLAAAVGAVPFLGTSFLPEFHEGNYILALTTLPGTSLPESMRLGKIVRQRLMKYPEVVSIDQRAGRSELDEDAQPPNFSEFDITLAKGKNGRSPEQLSAELREQLEKIPGVATNLGQFIAHRIDEVLSGIRAQVAVKIYGPDLETLRRLGDASRDVMAGIPGVVDLQLEQQVDVPSVHIEFRPDDAARYGITVADFARVIATGFNGVAASQVLEGQRSFDLFVRFPAEYRDSPEQMAAVLIDTPSGAKIPLSQVAKISLEKEPYFINRENVQRRIAVQCNVQGRALGDVIADIQSRIKAGVPLPPGYFVEYGGQFESQQRAQQTLLWLGIAAIIGIFVILFQAFGTTTEALLVMTNLPLALIGGVLAVVLVSREMSIPTIIGFISLFGIAARNGIMLVTHYRHLKLEDGLSFEDAIVKGSMDRLIPILMTAATAALGLLPLVLGDATGKEIERPLAVVILGGLFTSTFLNMIVVPTLFKRFARRAFDSARAEGAEAAVFAGTQGEGNG
ncbi:MAG: efflux RND transporter permease subunit [Acidobacteriota bacterium]